MHFTFKKDYCIILLVRNLSKTEGVILYYVGVVNGADHKFSETVQNDKTRNKYGIFNFGDH